MATAGIPANATPSAARPINNTANVGLAGSSSPMTVVAIADTSITGVRPNRSDRALAGMIDSASIPVVTETVRAAAAGLTPRSADSAGSTACVPYRAANVASPAANSAPVSRRYPAVPVVWGTGLAPQLAETLWVLGATAMAVDAAWVNAYCGNEQFDTL